MIIYIIKGQRVKKLLPQNAFEMVLIVREEYLSWFLCSFHNQDGIQRAF